MIDINECVHVLPMTGSKVCPPAIADAVNRTAPPPMIPKPLTAERRGEMLNFSIP